MPVPPQQKNACIAPEYTSACAETTSRNPGFAIPRERSPLGYPIQCSRSKRNDPPLKENAVLAVVKRWISRRWVRRQRTATKRQHNSASVCINKWAQELIHELVSPLQPISREGKPTQPVTLQRVNTGLVKHYLRGHSINYAREMLPQRCDQ